MTADLKSELEELIENHFRAGSFLESPAPAPGRDRRISRPSPKAPARSSAPTSCCSRSAKGAWASVYMAEQSEPVQRKVALKIIKPGMDTAQVIARFEAERQALALMDHPNIAKVLDAGDDRQRAGPTSSWNWSRACPSPSTATSTT